MTEQRLIDADALLDELKKHRDICKNNRREQRSRGFDTAISIVKYAPVVMTMRKDGKTDE